MKIQFLNWESRDRKIDTGSSKPEYKYVIFGFGRKQIEEDGQDYSISIILNNFYPYFYFVAECDTPLKSIMSSLEKKFASLCSEFKKRDKNYVATRCRQIGISYFNESYMAEFLKEQTQEVESQIFMGKGFENFKKRRFVKVFFKTQRAFRFFQTFIVYCDPEFTIYEGNINPMLKMFHDQNFQPSSWLEIDEKRLVKKNEMSKWTKADVEYVAYYSFFEKGILRVLHENNSLWFKLCSFDLECESSHGDYPVACKDYSKFIRELRKVLKAIRRKELETNETLLDDYVEAINNSIHGDTKYFSRIYLKRSDMDSLDKTELGDYLIKLSQEDSNESYELFHTFLKENWGEVEGDRIIQIGNIIEYPKGTYKKVIFCLNETEIENDTETIVYSCGTESELIVKWSDWFQREDPDILMGYNIFNFDNEYLWTRASECGVLAQVVQKLSRLENEDMQMKDMTKGTGKFFSMNGREMIDLMDYIKKNYSLDSYSLDNVSARFIRDKILKIDNETEGDARTHLVISKRPVGLRTNDFLKIYINNGIYEDKYVFKEKSKFKIKEISDTEIVLYDHIDLQQEFIIEWCLSKDDILPSQIFEFQKGSKYQRGLIAKYCIQDCMLCHYIFQKLEVLVNNMAMSNVCFVPFGYLFLRGQSVKIFSLIAKQCADENYRIPVKSVPYSSDGDAEDSDDNQESYEGALVLEPMVGIYINEPISVNDFNSLYPSCGIAENISPDTHVIDPAYLGLEGYVYNEVEFDELEYRHVLGKNGKFKKNKEAVKVGTKKCTFVVFPNQEKGILPKIWAKLLSERKETRKKMEKEKDAFRKTLLDGLQLAFKTTANSMYGIFGFKKSPLYYQDVAASITACGRRNLMFAKNFIETNYPGSKIVYGDTDSLFVSFPSSRFSVVESTENQVNASCATPSNAAGAAVSELDRIYESIDVATEAGDLISKQLKPPHNLGFEKCISPFILMSRKRYTGLYYTSKSPKKYMNTMGFALKRRDNALIVKEIVGNAIKMILYNKDIYGSIRYIKESIMYMLNGNYPIDKFIVTKTLRSSYANPQQISHYMLSLKMGERDPGNKPKVGDRIPFVFIQTKNENVKQSERIENPKYILDNPAVCKIDYMYYLTNQLMNPLLQVYKLIYKERTEEVIFSEVLSFAYQKRENMSCIRSFFTSSLTRKRDLEEQDPEREIGPKGEPPHAPLAKKSPQKKEKRVASGGNLKITNFFQKSG